MRAWIAGLIAAFTTDPHAAAVKQLADANGDGKVDLKDVTAAYEKAKAELKARQASYWNALGVALAAAAAGAYSGHRFWP